MTNSLSPLPLFGLSTPFLPPPWTITDDRVRGGSSTSHLVARPSKTARFYGHLDTSTLGGAGFASQFSPINEGKENKAKWDLSAYDGIEIQLGAGDGKVYTFILKDEQAAEKREDGRESAGISWEVEFDAPNSGNEDEDDSAKTAKDTDAGTKIWLPWTSFKATYRGKEKPDAEPLKTGEIRRVGLMMRR